MRSRVLALGALVIVSCGGKVVVDATPASSGTGGSGDASADCGDHGMPVPAIYKGCAADGDCTILFADLDCCGTQAVVGITASEAAGFTLYKKQCDVFPVCACDPGPAVTDDGQTTTTDVASIHVACKGGLCSTFVP